MKIFISHSMNTDGPLAHRLAEDLKKMAFDIWIATENIRESTDWVKAVSQGLGECEIVLLLLTPAAVHSPWVNLEMSAAIMLEREGRLRIIPILVETCEPPALWRAYQAIVLDEYENCLKKLRKVLTTGSILSTECTFSVEPQGAFQVESGVYCATFCPDGDMLFAGLHDGTILRWSLAKGIPLEPLKAHEKTINCLAFSPNGGLLASASTDQTVQIWIMPEGTLHRTIEGHTDSVRAVSFSPDGHLLVSSSRDGTLRLWSIPAGILVRVLQGHEKSVYDAAFAPDGNSIASVSSDNTVRLWAVDTGESTELGRLESTILSCVFSPSGEVLATGTWAGFIRLWNITDSVKGRLLEGHNDRVHRLVFSSDGGLLFSSSKDTMIRLWNVSEGKRAYPPLRMHSGWVRGLALSRDGTMLVSGDTDGLIQLWQIVTLVR